jgi:PHD/YefM family antitoxin component YafN of YafNO toxin-antitoxin module
MIKEKMIVISEKEYEGMKETIEILQDPDLMSQILESEQNIQDGRVKELVLNQ